MSFSACRFTTLRGFGLTKITPQRLTCPNAAFLPAAALQRGNAIATWRCRAFPLAPALQEKTGLLRTALPPGLPPPLRAAAQSGGRCFVVRSRRKRPHARQRGGQHATGHALSAAVQPALWQRGQDSRGSAGLRAAGLTTGVQSRAVAPAAACPAHRATPQKRGSARAARHHFHAPRCRVSAPVPRMARAQRRGIRILRHLQALLAQVLATPVSRGGFPTPKACEFSCSLF